MGVAIIGIAKKRGSFIQNSLVIPAKILEVQNYSKEGVAIISYYQLERCLKGEEIIVNYYYQLHVFLR